MKETKYPGYFINEKGEIFSARQPKLGLKKLKTRYYTNGYEYFSPRFYEEEIRGKGKTIHVMIHRLIFETFVHPIPEGMVINHKDGIKSNNSLDNLECVTHSQNLKHALDTGLRKKRTGEKHHSTKVSDNDVIDMILKIDNGQSKASVCREYNLEVTFLKNIVNGKNRKYIWDNPRLIHLDRKNLLKAKNGKLYSDELVLELIKESLKKERLIKDICKPYGIHPNELGAIKGGRKRKHLQPLIKKLLLECND